MKLSFQVSQSIKHHSSELVLIIF